jgi:hypothetical protein
MSDAQGEGPYADYVGKLSRQFETELATIEAGENFDYGDEFELAICRLLSRALPARFGVARGYAVALSGETAGDDIIIYDTTRFPTLWLRGGFAQKEHIPVEAICCYIEAKHTIDLNGEEDSASSLQHAIAQASKVKRLCGTRRSVDFSAIDPYTRMTEGFQVKPSRGFPAIRNPSFAMVVARRVRLRPKQRLLEDAWEVHRQLVGQSRDVATPPPDLMVLGHGNVTFPVVKAGEQGAEYLSPFLLPEENNVACLVRPNRALGCALVCLMHALDWMQMGRVNWINLLGYELDRSNAEQAARSAQTGDESARVVAGSSDGPQKA